MGNALLTSAGEFDVPDHRNELYLHLRNVTAVIPLAGSQDHIVVPLYWAPQDFREPVCTACCAKGFLIPFCVLVYAEGHHAVLLPGRTCSS